MKTCRTCGETKPLNAFNKHPKGLKGRDSRCSLCKREEAYRSHLKIKYGLSVEELNAMRVAQDYKCAVCGTEECTQKHGRHGLYIDHDHETGEVRGLLCHGCNTALGQVLDDPETLRKLALYIESFR